MKILFLLKYDKLGASSRVRAYQFFPFFEREGYKTQFEPLFSNKYLQIYNNFGKKDILLVVKSYWRRIIKLLKTKEFDLVWIEKEIFPFFPSCFETFLKYTGTKYIVDYDDAIFHNYDLNPNIIVKMLLRNKINRVMKNASAVIVGSDYIYAKAMRAGAKKIFFIPSSVDLQKYTYQKRFNEKNFIIGWIGSRSTGQYLNLIYEPLSYLSKHYDITLRLMGYRTDIFRFMPTEIFEWKEENENWFLNSIDVGIMPLNNGPWERGKCGYKLIQYMACGRPVIASPVGENVKIVRHGENGFLASLGDEWIEYLIKLINSVELRKKLGENGRKVVEQNYSTEHNFIKLIEIIKNVINE
jgi:glycosyltransferase involved in cell wall biosynthesis